MGIPSLPSSAPCLSLAEGRRGPVSVVSHRCDHRDPRPEWQSLDSPWGLRAPSPALLSQTNRPPRDTGPWAHCPLTVQPPSLCPQVTPLHSRGLGIASVVAATEILAPSHQLMGRGLQGPNSSSNEIPMVSSAEASVGQRTNNVE